MEKSNKSRPFLTKTWKRPLADSRAQKNVTSCSSSKSLRIRGAENEYSQHAYSAHGEKSLTLYFGATTTIGVFKRVDRTSHCTHLEKFLNFFSMTQSLTFVETRAL
jgi:hypothetical protein